MKKFILVLLIAISGFGCAFAKKDGDPNVEQRIKEVQEWKMKYLAQEMQLNEAQKKKFFEVYEEMTQAKIQCFKNAKILERKLKHDDNASEQDYQQVTDALNKANAEWSELEIKYNEKFSSFLSPKQIYIMKQSEMKFREKWDEMKHKRRKEHKDKK